MNKDFKAWAELKEKVEKRERKKIFFDREIWWCNLGINIGNEQDGKGERYSRPVLVYKKLNSKLFMAICLSTKIKEDNPYYCKFEFKGELQSAILMQIRIIDSKRLISKIGQLSEGKFGKIAQKFNQIYLPPN